MAVFQEVQYLTRASGVTPYPMWVSIEAADFNRLGLTIVEDGQKNQPCGSDLPA